MAYILHLETATKVCSVSLSKDGVLISIREDLNGQNHASLINSFIESALKDGGIGFKELDAIAVSQGPGSYTGLRIGVSSAKGLCYALGIPMIALPTLQSMTATLLMSSEWMKAYEKLIIDGKAVNADIPLLFCPMIDARRMEVYNALYNKNLEQTRDTKADIIDEASFDVFAGKNQIVFFGDGAAKCKEIIGNKHFAFFFDTFQVSSSGMVDIAFKAYLNKEFVNTAYFEPFYLKNYVAAPPKVKGLYD